MKKKLLLCLFLISVLWGSDFLWGQTQKINKRWKEKGVFYGRFPEQEIIANRTRTSKTFKNPNGTNTIYFSGLTHYKDESGRWQDINYAITNNSSGEYPSHKFCNTTHEIKSYFPEFPGNNGVVLGYDNNAISFWHNPQMRIFENGNILYSENSKEVSPGLLENKLTYPGIYSGIDEEMVILEEGNGIEDNIIINKLNPAISKNINSNLEFYQFIPLKEGWKIFDGTNEKKNDFTAESFSIKISREQNITLNPIIVFDNKIKNQKQAMELMSKPKERLSKEELELLNSSITNGVYKIHFVNGGIEVVYSFPYSWLANNSRQFPVTVDPSFTIGSASVSLAGLWDGYYVDTRKQNIYLASDFTGGGMANGDIITAIAINCSSYNCGPATQTGLTIRLQNTASATFGSTSFTNSGYTNCYSGGSQTISGTGWYTQTFGTNYTFNSSQNVIIDFSMDMAGYNCAFNDNYFWGWSTGVNRSIVSNNAGDIGDPKSLASGSFSVNLPYTQVTYSPGCVAPSISSQPSSQTACVGNSITFSITASGTGLTYQWRKNGVNIGGATSSSYTIGSVVLGDAASTPGYDCVVTGTCGTVTSSAATLTVNAASVLGTVNNVGPIDFCNAANDFTGAGTPITVSGNTGTIYWQWGSDNGTWNAWGSGTANPPAYCCFPSKVSSSDANADRFRWYVVNGVCPATAYSSSILVNNRYNAAPTSLSASSTSVCSGTVVTLTANFSSNIDILGTVEFATSCGGAPFASVTAGNNVNSVSTTVTPPVGTTTYYARYNPGTGTSCSPSSCVSIGVTATAAPTTATNTSTQTICSTGSATLSGNNPTTGTGAWTVQSGPSTASTQFANTTVYNTTFTPAGGAGSYVVRWTISNSPCTASFADATITVNAPPTTATNTSTQTICDNTSATLSGNNPAVGTGAWSVVSGPSTSSTQFGNTAVYNTTFTPAGGAGSYVIKWTISNSPCTASSANATITVNTLPQGSLSANYVCPGSLGQFTFTSTAGTGPFTLIISGTSYSGVVSGTPFNANPNPTSTTAYTLTSITDNNGCVRTSGITGANATITVVTCSSQILFPSNANAYIVIGNGSSTTDSVFLVLGNSATATFVNPGVKAGPYNGWIVSEGQRNYITWPNISTGSFVIPFGYSTTDYLPLTFNKTAGATSDLIVASWGTGSDNKDGAGKWATSTDAGTVAAVSNMNDPTYPTNPAVHAVIDRWWKMYPLAAATADVTFSYRGAEDITMDAGNQLGEIATQHWTGAGWNDGKGGAQGTYTNHSPAINGVNSGVGTFTALALTQFSPYVLVAKVAPLPVEWLDMSATCNFRDVLIKWSTATEQNSDYFTVERSPDGNNYASVVNVKAASNSSTVKNYSATDTDPLQGVSFYRVKETDFNGAFMYSAAVSIDGCAGDEVVIYGAGGDASVVINALQDGQYAIELYDMLGQKVTSELKNVTGGENYFKLNPGTLASAIYIVKVYNNTNSITKKVFIRSIE